MVLMVVRPGRLGCMSSNQRKPRKAKERKPRRTTKLEFT
jgi:hypothetical protein